VDAVRTIDDRLFLAVNAFARHTSWLHPAMVDYARYGVLLLAILLLAGLIVVRRSDSRLLAAAGWSAIAPLIALAVNQPLSHLIHEARPYASHPQVLLLVARSQDFSFPSDHTIMAGAVAAGLVIVSRRIGAIAVVAAVSMAFARVYVGAHYPWDVLVGLAMGAGITVLGWRLLEQPLTALARWLRRQPLIRLGFARAHTTAAGTPLVQARP
jgi:undecaprenyl-diphosphatase